jgi:hypothetical protein
MSYVSWPNVASTSFVESRLPKIKLIQLPQPAELAGGESYVSSLIDTSFLTNTGAGLVCIEVDGFYIKEGTGQDEISIDIVNSTESIILYQKAQFWNNGSGGGTRSSVILPLLCMVTQATIASGFKIRITNAIGGGGAPGDALSFEGKLQVKITQPI